MEERKLALLIDSDNVSVKYLNGIFDELAQYGIITYRRIYGDFTSHLNARWSDRLLEKSIIPIQQFSNTTGKNATDSALIIDAMDLLYTSNVDGFCIVSSDSDFTRLASRLRESGKIVIGMGEKKTPDSFRAACTIFTELENLIEDEKSARATNREAIEADIINIITQNDNRGKATGSGEIGSKLQNKYPDFDIRSFGYSQLSKFLEDIPALELRKENNTIMVGLKEESGEDPIIRDIVEIVKSRGGHSMSLATLGHEIRRRHRSFNVALYGYSQLYAFIDSLPGLSVVGERTERRVMYTGEELALRPEASLANTAPQGIPAPSQGTANPLQRTALSFTPQRGNAPQRAGGQNAQPGSRQNQNPPGGPDGQRRGTQSAPGSEGSWRLTGTLGGSEGSWKGPQNTFGNTAADPLQRPASSEYPAAMPESKNSSPAAEKESPVEVEKDHLIPEAEAPEEPNSTNVVNSSNNTNNTGGTDNTGRTAGSGGQRSRGRRGGRRNRNRQNAAEAANALTANVREETANAGEPAAGAAMPVVEMMADADHQTVRAETTEEAVIADPAVPAETERIINIEETASEIKMAVEEAAAEPAVKEPAVTEEPVIASEPVAVEETAASEPAAAEEPAVTEEPAAAEEQAAVEEPGVTEERAAVEEPAVTEEPAVATEPVAVEETAASESAEAEEPAAATEPVAVEEKAAATEPVPVEESITAETPADSEETAVEEPAVTEEPVAEEPVLNGENESESAAEADAEMSREDAPTESEWVVTWPDFEIEVIVEEEIPKKRSYTRRKKNAKAGEPEKKRAEKEASVPEAESVPTIVATPAEIPAPEAEIAPAIEAAPAETPAPEAEIAPAIEVAPAEIPAPEAENVPAAETAETTAGEVEPAEAPGAKAAAGEKRQKRPYHRRNTEKAPSETAVSEEKSQKRTRRSKKTEETAASEEKSQKRTRRPKKTEEAAAGSASSGEKPQKRTYRRRKKTENSEG